MVRRLWVERHCETIESGKAGGVRRGEGGGSKVIVCDSSKKEEEVSIERKTATENTKVLNRAKQQHC